MKLRRLSTGKLVEIADADKLGGGGEGVVYRFGNDLVAKIYTDHVAERRAKLEAMLANPPEDNATKGHSAIAWPIDLLIELNRPEKLRGYLMPRVRAGVEVHRIWDFKTRVKLNYTAHELHVVALNIASAFQALHHKGYVITDVNQKNVFVNDRGLVTLIDTDSFQVPRPGGGWFRGAMGMPDFTPPELQGVDLTTIDRSEEHDLFGLGVLLFKVLMLGFHPFDGKAGDKRQQGTPLETRIERANFPFGRVQRPFSKPVAAPALEGLAPDLRDMFITCFEDGARDPSRRPRAGAWRAALDRARKDLTNCRANAKHRFSAELSQCPWCEIRGRVKSGGKGLDYFPENASQIPLAKPARAKPGVTVPKTTPAAFSSSGLNGSSLAAFASPPTAMPPMLNTGSSSGSSLSSMAGSSQGGSLGSASGSGSSSPSLGAIIGNALLSLLESKLSPPSSGGAYAPVRPQPRPQPEFDAGRWRFQLGVVPQSWDPILVGADVYFDVGGNFNGTGLLACLRGQMPCQVGGYWQFDPHGKVLTLDSVINGAPTPRQHLRIVGGGNGRYQMVSSTGYPVGAMRLA